MLGEGGAVGYQSKRQTDESGNGDDYELRESRLSEGVAYLMRGDCLLEWSKQKGVPNYAAFETMPRKRHLFPRRFHSPDNNPVPCFNLIAYNYTIDPFLFGTTLLKSEGANKQYK